MFGKKETIIQNKRGQEAFTQLELESSTFINNVAVSISEMSEDIENIDCKINILTAERMSIYNSKERAEVVLGNMKALFNTETMD